MKTKVLLILYSLIITLYSCQNSMDEYIEQNIPRTSANTRSNINKPWIECKECILKSGKKYYHLGLTPSPLQFRMTSELRLV